MVVLNPIYEHGGDVQLPEDSDLSVYQTFDGAVLKLNSAKQTPVRHLTYSMTLSATQGLRLVLMDQEEYRAANFEIVQDGMCVSSGRILAF